MSKRAEHLAQAQALVVAVNYGDAAAIVRTFAPTISWRRGDGTSITGRDEVAACVHAVLHAFPDAELSEVRLLALGDDAVLVEWMLEGTHQGDLSLPGMPAPLAATGREVCVTGADLLRFDGAGAIVADEARIDLAELLRQLGATISPRHAPEMLRDFAMRYTAAWCSQEPERVASFFAEDGSLAVNGGAPAIGRAAIARSAHGFMTAFPDLRVTMDDLLLQGDRAVYQWTLTGTNTGPGGTGHAVRVSGYEVWRFAADGLVAESRGYFDSAAYERQVQGSAPVP